MSLPNPINVTYVSPLISDTFPFIYIVKDTDNIINIDSTHGEVHVILRNIRNSGMLQYQPLLSINDGGNNASVYNITIYPSEGDVINDNTSYVLTNDGANSIIQISDINQWVVSSSQSGGGGGTLLDGLSYTYVYGNGANALENGQQLSDGYADAKTKVVIDNPTINYGALEIVSEDGTYFYSAPLNTALLEPYFSNGQLQQNVDFEFQLDGANFFAQLIFDGTDYIIRGDDSGGGDVVGFYDSAIIFDFYYQLYRSVLIVGAGYYELDGRLRVNEPYVDIVSLTGNCDVFLTNIDDDTNGRAMEIEDDNVYIRGINVGTQYIEIDSNYSNLKMENCIGGDRSFSTRGNDVSGTFINCIGGYESFGYDCDVTGTFINCTGGNASFGGDGGDAMGTFINCTSGDGSFGQYAANGVFENCKAGQNSFGYYIASGTFRNCISDMGGFGGYGDASGYFYNCVGEDYCFGGDQTFGRASGQFYNCTATYESFGGQFSSGNFYDCVGTYRCFGGFGNASGYFYNCTATYQSFGSQNASGYFYNCRGTSNCFGVAYDCNVDGYFENCIGDNECFGAYTEGQVNGTFLNCSGGDYSFGGGTILGGFLNGIFSNCKGGSYSFGGGRTNMQIRGTFKNCIGGNYSFGQGTSNDLLGFFYDCKGGVYSFGGGSNNASGIYSNCVGGDYSFGEQASGTFNHCVSGNNSFGSNLATGIFSNCIGGGNSFGSFQEASGKFINCVGGFGSFGLGAPPYINGILTGQLYYCVLTSGTFQTVSGGGRTFYCVDALNNTNNQ
jgi:hypothetical protein